MSWLSARERVVADPPPPLSASFDAVYQRSWWPMLRVAVGLVDDIGSAEDVVQDAFAQLYRRWDGLHDGAAATAYLRVCVVNGSRSALRRRRTARKHLHAVHTGDAPPADETVLLDAEHAAVREALTRLPDRQREVLTLRYLGALPDADIAAATGLSLPGVRSASSRGLAALRHIMGEQS